MATILLFNFILFLFLRFVEAHLPLTKDAVFAYGDSVHDAVHKNLMATVGMKMETTKMLDLTERRRAMM